MKLTRRDFATVLAPAAALAGSPEVSRAAPPDPQSAGDGLLESARARMKANVAALDEQAVPMDTAPAFQFKA